MKKFLLLLILAGVFFACSKTDDVIPASNLKTAVEPNTTWHDNGAIPGVEGVDYGCWGDPTNCLPEIEITISPSPDVLRSFCDVVGSGNSASINKFINDHYSDLSRNFDTTILDGILNGSYNVILRGSLSSGHAFIVVLNGHTVIYTRPLK